MEPKSLWHLTFGQSHPLRKGWIEIEATTQEEAQKLATEVFGQKFANIYDHTLFDIGLFPGGKFGETLK